MTERVHNRERHGLYTARAALERLGSRAIDPASPVGQALAAWCRDVAADLGGDLSTSQQTILDLAARTKLMLDSIDVWLVSQPSLVNKRARKLHPAVLERRGLANDLASYLVQLGLERHAKEVPDLRSYLAQRAQDAADGENGDEPNAQAASADECSTAPEAPVT